MTAYTRSRGHEAYHDGVCWRFIDTDELVDASNRPCARCGKPPTPEGFDACQGYVPGATSVCCGHGFSQDAVCIMEEIKINEGGKHSMDTARLQIPEHSLFMDAGPSRHFDNSKIPGRRNWWDLEVLQEGSSARQHCAHVAAVYFARRCITALSERSALIDTTGVVLRLSSRRYRKQVASLDAQILESRDQMHFWLEWGGVQIV